MLLRFRRHYAIRFATLHAMRYAFDFAFRFLHIVNVNDMNDNRHMMNDCCCRCTQSPPQYMLALLLMLR